MRHFTFNKIINILGALVFLILGIFLIVVFALSFKIVDELQQASNLSNYKFFILASSIMALLVAVVFIFGFWKVRNLMPPPPTSPLARRWSWPVVGDAPWSPRPSTSWDWVACRRGLRLSARRSTW